MDYDIDAILCEIEGAMEGFDPSGLEIMEFKDDQEQWRYNIGRKNKYGHMVDWVATFESYDRARMFLELVDSTPKLVTEMAALLNERRPV